MEASAVREEKDQGTRILLQEDELEHRLLVLQGDADACFADRDLDHAVLWGGRDFDPPSLRRELDGIR
jgi:hypothetical protein